MAKTHNELTEGYWFFRDGDEITIVQLEKPTATSPLYILWPGNDAGLSVTSYHIENFVGPVTMPGDTPAVAVKALDWHEIETHGGRKIYAKSHGMEWRLDPRSRTLDADKAKAQQEFNSHIQSALSSQARSVEEQQAWQKLDNAFSNFVNCYGDPFEPKLKYEREVADRVKTLYAEFNNYRAIRK